MGVVTLLPVVLMPLMGVVTQLSVVSMPLMGVVTQLLGTPTETTEGTKEARRATEGLALARAP